MSQADGHQLKQIGQELTNLCEEMLKLEASILAEPLQLHGDHSSSARNLAHYLALRRHDIREMQTRLASVGLSSLGRTEGHVMSGIRSVLALLNKLGAAENAPSPEIPPIEFGEDRKLLERNTAALLGPVPKGRTVRIMVTVDTEAATNYEHVKKLLASGMDCMRINCAHDNEELWTGMIRNLQKAREETGRPCRILMDIAGPKLRTGTIEPGSPIIKVRPKRDEMGKVEEAARIWLVPTETGNVTRPTKNEASIPINAESLKSLRKGDKIVFRDAREAPRILIVERVEENRILTEMEKTAYFVPGLEMRVKPHAAKSEASELRLRVGSLPKTQQTLLLKPGDTLVLARSPELGRPAQLNKNGSVVNPARIGVTLPEFFDHAKPGEPIWFDDGKIGGEIRSVGTEAIHVEITHARPEGERLGAEKGINLPETKLHISALTSEDLKNLEFIVQNADLVGYSFVRSEHDVRQLQEHLARLGGESLGVILKIETREAFENLPRLILSAMRTRAVGIMIARGDLAVECGYQRLAEVQEEILWIAEAAHLPVVWATQVLENLAKKGMPSRSEITDAAVGERAECVMLNKGPYAATAVEILDDILRRMQTHQEKKSAMLRRLHLATAFAAAS
jgi:pyruvate kinase